MKQLTSLEVYKAEKSIRLSRALLCVGVIVLWSGLPLSIVGLDRSLGVHATSVIIILGLIAYFIQLLQGRQRLDIWILAPLLLLAAMLFSTIMTSLYFFHNPASSWMKASSGYSPLFLIFLLRAADTRLSEVLGSIVVVSVLTASLVFVDHFSRLAILDDYVANSGFSSTNHRVLLMKNEVSFGFMICFSRFARSSNPWGLLGYGLLVVLLGFDLIVATESRLVLGAALLGLAVFILIGVSAGRKLIIIAASILLVLSAGQVIFGKYVDRLTSTKDYATQDISVRWRLVDLQHYRGIFERTDWVGFGIMSSSPKEENILTYSLYKAAPLYGGSSAWGLYLADLGILGMLFQFGFTGLLIAVFMSFYASLRMIGNLRRPDAPYAKDVAALGCLMLFMVLNPWPQNMFGLTLVIMSGNLLWYTAARSARFARRRRAPAPPVPVRMVVAGAPTSV